jgi:hypothetical protein
MYDFEGKWDRENTGSGVEGTLIWIGNQTPLMVDRTPSLENEKVYDRDAGDAIPLSDLHQLGKEVGSRVADVGNGAHHESTAEDYDTLVESTDPDLLDLSRDQVHAEGKELKHEGMEGETMAVTGKVDPGRRKSTVNGENRLLIEVVDPESLTGDHAPFRKETGKHEFMEGEGVVVEKGRQGQASEMYGGRESMGERVAAIEKGKQCQSIEAFSGGRKSTGDSVVILEKREQCPSLKTFSGGRKSAGKREVVIGKG